MASVVRPTIPLADRVRNERLLIGELLVARGVLSPHDVARIVSVQQERGLRFGETGVHLGLIKESDTQEALALQFEYPYVHSGDSNLSADLACAYDPFGAKAEAVRNLRSQLILHWFKDSNKAITAVAPRNALANSSLLANLAISFAQLGERTLLIDANLRSGIQHRLFGVPSGDGLAGVLSGRETLKSAIIDSVENFERLSLLCAGYEVPNPQELLGRVPFAYLMEALPESFDVVLVDVPPALQYADAQLIIAKTHGCIITTKRNETTVDDVKHVQMQVQNLGATLLGAVLID